MLYDPPVPGRNFFYTNLLNGEIPPSNGEISGTLAHKVGNVP